MVSRNVKIAVLAGALLVIGGCPAFAAEAADASAGAPVAKPASGSAPSFVAPDFTVPKLVETATFRIVPLGPDLAKVDFDAYMSSIEHLQATFSRSTAWPHQGISAADAMGDMETEQGRFRSRKSFAYAVLTPDGRRERGCVYVSPSPVAGYDAVVRMWVTKAEYDAGFDAELYQWVVGWMQRDWPFAKIAYPGRAIAWSDWDASVTANKAGKSAL